MHFSRRILITFDTRVAESEQQTDRPWWSITPGVIDYLRFCFISSGVCWHANTYYAQEGEKNYYYIHGLLCFFAFTAGGPI